MDDTRRPIAITPGEPAGIGPDILLKLVANNIQQRCRHPLIAIADRDLLNARAKQLRLTLRLLDAENNDSINTKPSISSDPCSLYVKHIPTIAPSTPGQLTQKNSPYVINTIEHAANGCMSHQYAAMVTGPVHKSIIHQAGIAFSGHTDYLATLTNTQQTVMLFVSNTIKNTMKLALLTTHIPLNKVSEQITQEKIINAIKIIQHACQTYFQLPQPRIAVCGLNPHAGEQGTLGNEEQNIIIPAVKHCHALGIHLIGPMSADTAFTPNNINNTDVFLTMYHDQGLPVFKHLNFHQAVNVSLGLPIIRTSVDHGTALDLAGTGHANADSLAAAIELADWMAP